MNKSWVQNRRSLFFALWKHRCCSQSQTNACVWHSLQECLATAPLCTSQVSRMIAFWAHFVGFGSLLRTVGVQVEGGLRRKLGSGSSLGSGLRGRVIQRSGSTTVGFKGLQCQVKDTDRKPPQESSRIVCGWLYEDLIRMPGDVDLACNLLRKRAHSNAGRESLIRPASAYLVPLQAPIKFLGRLACQDGTDHT